MLRRGARPGPGKMHSMAALLQLEHGCLLSHRTFLFLHVTQDLGFGWATVDVEVDVPLEPLTGGEPVFCRLLAGLLGGPPLLLGVVCAAGGDVGSSVGLAEKPMSG